jgi:hypothetical protein
MSFEEVFTKEEIYKIGKYLVQNGEWRRFEDGERSSAFLSIPLPYDADLSSVGSRVWEVNKKIKGEK